MVTNCMVSDLKRVSVMWKGMGHFVKLDALSSCEQLTGKQEHSIELMLPTLTF